MIRVILPPLGDDISEAVVACWHAQTGDSVQKDEDLVELVTDKATFHVSVPGTGILKNIIVPEGGTVKVGAVLAEIEVVAS